MPVPFSFSRYVSLLRDSSSVCEFSLYSDLKSRMSLWCWVELECIWAVKTWSKQRLVRQSRQGVSTFSPSYITLSFWMKEREKASKWCSSTTTGAEHTEPSRNWLWWHCVYVEMRHHNDDFYQIRNRNMCMGVPSHTGAYVTDKTYYHASGYHHMSLIITSSTTSHQKNSVLLNDHSHRNRHFPIISWSGKTETY